jgi:hypothetical protein
MYGTANEIVNGAAVETGLAPVLDIFASTDPNFRQLSYLLNSCGEELLGLHTWQRLIKTHTIVTAPGDDGNYDLPDDFSSMIDQTGWVPTNRLPLGGPLSPQDYTYLVNTNLASSTIYISFRVADGQFKVLPDPPPENVTINFEYISSYWVTDADDQSRKAAASKAGDVVLYEKILMLKFLKLRFLEAKGFDTTAALGQFQTSFMQWTGKDISAPVLSMARNRVFPYLDWRNIPETNFGLP